MGHGGETTSFGAAKAFQLKRRMFLDRKWAFCPRAQSFAGWFSAAGLAAMYVGKLRWLSSAPKCGTLGRDPRVVP